MTKYGDSECDRLQVELKSEPDRDEKENLERDNMLTVDSSQAIQNGVEVEMDFEFKKEEDFKQYSMITICQNKRMFVISAVMWFAWYVI